LSARVRVVESSRLSRAELEAVYEIFDATYDQANLPYIEKSRAVLRYVALAESRGEIVGFSFGDSVERELPRLQGPQAISLAGIGCVRAEAQRQGLFGRMAFAAIEAGGAIRAGRRSLFAGRMAHAVTYRTMAAISTSVVPRAGSAIGAWHEEIVAVVARLYGVEVDLETFVVRGGGVPVGYPRIVFEETREEQALFAAVDRARGDSLLSVCWVPDAPRGWAAPG